MRESTILHLGWLDNLTMELRLLNHSTATIRLTPSGDTPCLFSGRLEHERESLVAVSGCRSSRETTVSIASIRVPEDQADIVIVGGKTYLKEHNRKYEYTERYKRQIGRNDILEVPPSGQDYEMNIQNNEPLPARVILETGIVYDNSLLEKFNGSHIRTQQWINKVIELARPKLNLPSLTVKISLKIVGKMEYHSASISATSEYIYQLRTQNSDPTKFLSFFCLGSGDENGGIACGGCACRRGIVISEYKSEIGTANIFAHELGHTIGMK